VVLLPGVRDRGDAGRVAALIGQAVRGPIEFDGRELRVGSSLGIAIYPDDGRHIDALLKIADEDMYRTKLGRRSNSLRRISRKPPYPEADAATDRAAPLQPVPDRDLASMDA